MQNLVKLNTWLMRVLAVTFISGVALALLHKTVPTKWVAGIAFIEIVLFYVVSKKIEKKLKAA